MAHINSFVESGGRRLEISWGGHPPDKATTLVFLHEGLGCAAMWREFPFDLAAATGCGALVYSRLGYGGSDACDLPRPLRFMHHEGLIALPALLKKMAVRDCILIGHSDGGSIGIVNAGSHPQNPLRGLITMAAHVFCETVTVKSIQSARKNYLEGDLRGKLKKYHGRNVDCAFWGWNDAWLHPEFTAWTIEEYLPGIKVPLLAIQGQDDVYGTAAQVESIVSRAGGPAESLMLTDCGHAPHIDRRDETFNAMQDFILNIKPQ